MSGTAEPLSPPPPTKPPPKAPAGKVQVPGPGAHDPPAFFGGPVPNSRVASPAVFSIPREPRKPAERKDRTGPTLYSPNYDVLQKDTPSYRFGNQKRMLSEAGKVHHETPGPALALPAAVPADNPNFPRSPGYHFGTTDRVLRVPVGSVHSSASPSGRPNPKTELDRREHYPGPGQHDPDDTVKSKVLSGPKHVMTPRREPYAGVHTHNPGPGAYDRQQKGHELNSPRCKFGMAARMLVADESKPVKTKGAGHGGPGPGAYAGAVSRTRDGTAIGDSAPKWSMPGRATFDIAKGFV